MPSLPIPSSAGDAPDQPARHQTGLITIVFTDLVGSTALKQQVGDRTGASLIQQHHLLIRELLRGFNGGEEIETAGDSFLIVFPRPSDAVHFGLLLQARLRVMNQGSPARLEERIGIHVGEVVIREQDGSVNPKGLSGIQVDTCARVMALAQGGQILLTRFAFDNARQMLKGEDVAGVGPLEWLNYGTYLLKGVEAPLEVCEVGEVGMAPLQAPAGSEKAQRQVTAESELALGSKPVAGSGGRPFSPRKALDSLAVLPFENVGSDPDAEYLSDGITESIIHSVSEFPKVRVMARSTVFRYKGRTADPQAVGRQLNVRAVLTGRVMQRGDSLIIGVELVDTTNGWRLWGKQFQRPVADVFAVQEEIAREISENLRVNLTGREKKRLARRPTENRQAYELYLKGRYFWNKRTEESLRKGIEFFRKVIEVDPTYALAYAGLAESYMPLGYWGFVPPVEAYPKGKAWALKALELDDQLAEAYTPLAVVLFVYERDRDAAVKTVQRAIALNPNYPRARQVYGEFLISLGDFNRAATEVRQALEIDPLSPIIHAVDAQVSLYARRYEEAMQKCRNSLELDPSFSIAFWFMGMACEQLGRFEEAVEHFQRGLELRREHQIVRASLARTYALWGKEDKARELLQGLEKTSEQKYVPAYSFAGIWAALGDRVQTFLWLEKACEERSARLQFFDVEPAFDTFRSDARFQAILLRARLPEPERTHEG